MSYRGTCRITVGDYQTDFCAGVEIESTWRKLTDTATVRLPKMLRYQGTIMADLIQPGMPIEVELGYDERNERVYKGYVTSIKPSLPMELACEDEMYQLKLRAIKPKTFRSPKLGDILEYIGITDYVTVWEPEGIGNVRIGAKQHTAAKVLAWMYATFGAYCYYRDGKLCVGGEYNSATAKEHAFHLQHNVANDKSLEYRTAESTKLQVRATSNLPDGKKITVELGDKRGDERTLNFYNLGKAELERRALEKLKELRYDGYRGEFEAFGIPRVKHGDIVELTDEYMSDRAGTFWVDKVKTRFGPDAGYRQTIQLGLQVR